MSGLDERLHLIVEHLFSDAGTDPAVHTADGHGPSTPRLTCTRTARRQAFRTITQVVFGHVFGDSRALEQFVPPGRFTLVH
jgi:hypothetical protein